MQMNNTQMPQAAKNQQPQDTEQTYAVTVDGQTLELTLEQLIAAAEQGLSRANDAAKRSQNGGQGGQSNIYQSFLSAYPDINAQDIPPEVWDDANRSGDLLGAYRAFEIRKLREELEQRAKSGQPPHGCRLGAFGRRKHNHRSHHSRTDGKGLRR